MTEWDDLVLVGRIARPHGIHGQVVVDPETDFVDDRFAVGARLHTRGAGGDETLQVTAFRVHRGRPVIGLDGFASAEEVRRLAGQELRVPEQMLRPLGPGSFYHHQLVGCAVETLEGERVGVVAGVEGGAGGSRLLVRGARSEVQVPLAAEICVDIDVEAKRIRIAPPEGLLDLNEVRHRHNLPADGGGGPRGRRRRPRN